MLAERLGWEWADADDVLEANHGKSIRGIFAEEGEAGFRDKEAAVLVDLCGRRRCVVSTGGGVVVREANRALLRASGRVVWLTADAETLWRRLQDDGRTGERRPALTVGGRAEVEEVLRLREAWYGECAHFTVRTEGRPPEAVAAEIAGAWDCHSGFAAESETPIKSAWGNASRKRAEDAQSYEALKKGGKAA